MKSGTIRIKVPQLLKERNLNTLDLMYGARIASGTAYALSSEEKSAKLTSLNFDTLVKLCVFFDVGITDILELDIAEQSSK